MATIATTATPTGWSELPRARTRAFLHSPAFDLGLLVLSPLWALALGALLSRSLLASADATALGLPVRVLVLAVGVLNGAHLFATFARTHGNARVFRRHPLRFTLVPAVLLAVLIASPGARVLAVVLTVVWDVHHSGLQTFGLARMYDRIRGNDTRRGRGLDLVLNQLLYAGPVLAGAGFLVHANAFYALRYFGAGTLASIPEIARNVRPALGVAVLGLGLPFLAVYVLVHAVRARRGEPVAWLKVALLVSTGLTSVVSYGFDPFGQALLTMKTFHVVQYLALLARTEGGSLAAALGKPAGSVGPGRVLAVLTPPTLVCGGFAALVTLLPDAGEGAGLGLVLTVTLLHFWYDGFIWSVREGEL